MKKDAIITSALCALLVLVVAGTIWLALAVQAGERKYSDWCAEQKGVAVRDLEGKMRCVPMFAASRGKP